MHRSNGAPTSKDYGAQLRNSATRVLGDSRHKSMAQLAFEELEERILLRSDLSQYQVVETGVDILVDRIQVRVTSISLNRGETRRAAFVLKCPLG